jgi:hypothetical protein
MCGGVGVGEPATYQVDAGANDGQRRLGDDRVRLLADGGQHFFGLVEPVQVDQG